MFPNGAPTGSRLIPTHPLTTKIPEGLPMDLARLFVAAAIQTRRSLQRPTGGKAMSLPHAAETLACGP